MAESPLQSSTIKEVIGFVQIALDTYDDLFSDFDTAPYQTRTISHDFLKELNKRLVETDRGTFELRFSLPVKMRNVKIEVIIKKRLKQYFEQKMTITHHHFLKETKIALIKLIIGFVLLSTSVFIEYFSISDIWIHLLFVILVPAGWFLLYTSFESLVDHRASYYEKEAYFKKLSTGAYSFVDEESVLATLDI